MVYPKQEFSFCDGDHAHDERMEHISDELPDEEELADMAELFKVFGDSTRIKILFILSKCDMCVCDIARTLGLSQPAVSYQLKVLKQAKLIRSRKSGKAVCYSLADSHVEMIIGMAKEHLEE